MRDRDIDVRRREMRERDQKFFNVFLRKAGFVSANCKACLDSDQSHVWVPPVLAQNKEKLLGIPEYYKYVLSPLT